VQRAAGCSGAALCFLLAVEPAGEQAALGAGVLHRGDEPVQLSGRGLFLGLRLALLRCLLGPVRRRLRDGLRHRHLLVVTRLVLAVLRVPVLCVAGLCLSVALLAALLRGALLLAVLRWELAGVRHRLVRARLVGAGAMLVVLRLRRLMLLRRLLRRGQRRLLLDWLLLNRLVLLDRLRLDVTACHACRDDHGGVGLVAVGVGGVHDGPGDLQGVGGIHRRDGVLRSDHERTSGTRAGKCRVRPIAGVHSTTSPACGAASRHRRPSVAHRPSAAAPRPASPLPLRDRRPGGPSAL
jgi:hypothetical protein